VDETYERRSSTSSTRTTDKFLQMLNVPVEMEATKDEQVSTGLFEEIFRHTSPRFGAAISTKKISDDERSIEIITDSETDVEWNPPVPQRIVQERQIANDSDDDIVTTNPDSKFGRYCHDT
jgi:hypothetical protein